MSKKKFSGLSLGSKVKKTITKKPAPTKVEDLPPASPPPPEIETKVPELAEPPKDIPITKPERPFEVTNIESSGSANKPPVTTISNEAPSFEEENAKDQNIAETKAQEAEDKEAQKAKEAPALKAEDTLDKPAMALAHATLESACDKLLATLQPHTKAAIEAAADQKSLMKWQIIMGNIVQLEQGMGLFNPIIDQNWLTAMPSPEISAICRGCGKVFTPQWRGQLKCKRGCKPGE